jgi:hypothetical protein
MMSSQSSHSEHLPARLYVIVQILGRPREFPPLLAETALRTLLPLTSNGGPKMIIQGRVSFELILR